MNKINIKLNKRIKFIIIADIILLILGLLYPSLVNKALISTKVTTYIENLINSKYTIDSLIKTNLINNLFENLSICILTLLLFTFPIVIIIYFIKTFSIGVSISSIIYIYKLKGILYSLFITIPSLISLFIITISFYYSLSYFIIRVRYRRKVSQKRLIKGYLKVFLITTILQIIVAFVDSYLSYYIFKLI